MWGEGGEEGRPDNNYRERGRGRKLPDTMKSMVMKINTP